MKYLCPRDFRRGEMEEKMTNAIIENKNAIIKCVKKNANGYTNWERFRNQIMYVLDSKDTYSLYSMQKENKAAKPCSWSFKAMWGINHPTLLKTQNFMTTCYFGTPKKMGLITPACRRSLQWKPHSRRAAGKQPLDHPGRCGKTKRHPHQKWEIHQEKLRGA